MTLSALRAKIAAQEVAPLDPYNTRRVANLITLWMISLGVDQTDVAEAIAREVYYQGWPLRASAHAWFTRRK